MVKMWIKERPIVLRTDEVKPIVAGEPIQLYRPIKPQPESIDSPWPDDNSHLEFGDLIRDTNYYVGCGWCPYGKPGDHLWIKETWAAIGIAADLKTSEIKKVWNDSIVYRADVEQTLYYDWHSAIYMPRSIARIVLEITQVGIVSGEHWDWVINFRPIRINSKLYFYSSKKEN